MEKQPILKINKLSKSFPGIKALDQVDFALYPGEVHILAGENGAGKSTLVKSILGIHSPEEGEICYCGNQVSFSSPKEAIEAGINAVHQELSMIPYLDAAHNIYFQREPLIKGLPLIDHRKLYGDTKRILEKLHCDHIPQKVPVKNLGVANQQMIEIAKALSFDSRILIFDEPTATLSEREVEFLFEQILQLKRQGIAILYISHRMGEFRRIGDRVTVLRDGKKIITCSMEELTDEELTHHMIGRELGHFQKQKRSLPTNGSNKRAPLLEVEKISDYKGKVQDCSLDIYPGEIVGLAGLVGSGRSQLAQLLYGIDHVKSGKIIYHGKNITGSSTETMASLGLGYVPEERKTQGLALKAPISWNITSSSLNKYFPNHFLSHKKNDEIARKYVEELQIATPDIHKISGQLSGGNQQKIVIGKWLASDTDLLIFDEPTRGVDIGAKMEIYQTIEQLAKQGKGILLISSEMEELINLSDRIYVMNQGRISDSMEKEDYDIEKLGKKMFSEEKHEANHNSFHFKKNLLLHMPPAFYMILILMAIFGVISDHYFTFSNFSNILGQAAPLLAIACGQTLIVLLQGTDLSLGSVMTLTGVLWIFLLNQGLPMIPSIFLCLCAGLIMGYINGFISAKGLIPVFIVTLGTQNIYRSVALLLSGSQTLYYPSNLFRIIGKGTLCHITWSFWIAFLCFLLTLILLKRTRFGMTVKGLGGNKEALHFMGLNIAKQEMKIFLYAGIMAAIGGLLLCCRIESGNPNAGNGMEFNAIAAVLLGGTSMREGRGGVEGTIFGVLLIQILTSGLMKIGISSVYQSAAIGIIVLAAIIFDALIKKKDESGR